MEAILAGGHVLVEDIPGVGKTSLALAFAKVLDLEQNRVQFTPDVLPADITGFSLYRKELGGRTQPRDLAHAVGASGGDGRAKCNSRWNYTCAPGTISCDCDREPDRICRNTDASGVSA